MKKLLCTVITTISLIITQPCSAITMHIVDGEVRDVLATLGMLAQKNIVTDSSCTGTISLNVRDMDFDKALSIVTTSKALSATYLDDVILVMSEEQSKKAGLNLFSFKLNYAKASELKDVLQNLAASGKVSAEPISNTIFYYGSQNESSKLKKAIQIMDVPTKQITLEAKILSISRENSRDLGINWSWDSIPQNSFASDDSSTDADYGGRFKFWRGYSFNFAAKLNALITSGKAKILARPHIITIPGKEASIFIGDHIPVQTEKHTNSESYTTTEYVDAGIKLRYTPIVNAAGTMVTAEVHTEVATPTLVSDLKNYRISSRKADTHVRMLSGETLVIGGLIGEEESKSVQRIPLLSKIPLFGHLFKNSSKKKTKSEVLMFLTPYITDAGQSPAIYNKTENEKENPKGPR
ncbi:MAG: type II and III secretion system protein [Phascolarctobacterium sp.]|nr:type II and III secretion system protein [Phascolarctobacterium sp.]